MPRLLCSRDCPVHIVCADIQPSTSGQACSQCLRGAQTPASADDGSSQDSGTGSRFHPCLLEGESQPRRPCLAEFLFSASSVLRDCIHYSFSQYPLFRRNTQGTSPHGSMSAMPPPLLSLPPLEQKLPLKPSPGARGSRQPHSLRLPHCQLSRHIVGGQGMAVEPRNGS